MEHTQILEPTFRIVSRAAVTARAPRGDRRISPRGMKGLAKFLTATFGEGLGICRRPRILSARCFLDTLPEAGC
jgi:hypothetical protein